MTLQRIRVRDSHIVESLDGAIFIVKVGDARPNLASTLDPGEVLLVPADGTGGNIQAATAALSCRVLEMSGTNTPEETAWAVVSAYLGEQENHDAE